MTSESAGYLVAGLCSLQLAAGLAAVAGRHRFASWAALICPVGILLICVERIESSNHLADLGPPEWAFLAANLVSAVAAIGLIRSRAWSALAYSGLWLLNSSLCAFMVYLAFFFRLF